METKGNMLVFPGPFHQSERISKTLRQVLGIHLYVMVTKFTFSGCGVNGGAKDCESESNC